MKDFSKQAFGSYRHNLLGLPSFCRLVMYEAFEYIDYASGTISITSLDTLARSNFQVDSARGRQKEIITGDTIRNAFRTIKKAKPDFFKFTTVNQRIVIEMPFLRDLYQSMYNQAKELAEVLSTNVTGDQTQAQIDDQSGFDPELAEELDPILAAASFNYEINTHANNKQTKTNQNTQTDGVIDSFLQLEKHPIADDFYPSDSIINHALSKGLTKVTDLSEIKKFILYNQAISSVRVDHNPLFLRWLERDAEHTEKLNKRANSQQKWSKNNECHGHRFDPAETANRGEHGAHTYVISGEYIERFGGRADIEEQHRMAVDAVDQSVWQTIPYQTRCPR